MTDPNAAYGWNAQANYSNYGAPATAQAGQQAAGYAAGNAAGKFIQCTMGQNQVILRHQKFAFPREKVSKVSERANGRATGSLLTSLFLFFQDHSAMGLAGVKYVLCITQVFGFLSTVPHSLNRHGSQPSVEHAIPATTTAAAASATGVGRPSCGTSGCCSTILAEFGRRRNCRFGRRCHRQERW